jgi:hypothetical protein
MAGPRKGASSVEVYGFVGWIASFVASGGQVQTTGNAVTPLHQYAPGKRANKCSGMPSSRQIVSAFNTAVFGHN